MSLRVGLVGLGFGEKVLLPALRRTRGVRVAAVACAHPAKAQDAARRLGIPRAASGWQELAEDPSIDALVMAVPTDVQVRVAERALRASKSVFCDKPLAVDARQAAALARWAQKRCVVTAVDFEFVEMTTWAKALSLLKSGAIGDLRELQVTWDVQTYGVRHDLHSWKTSSERGGGALNAFASHTFHYVEAFAGRMTRLYCRLHRASGLKRVTGETGVHLVMRTGANVLVTASVVTHAPGEPLHRLQFIGSRGHMVLENPLTDYVSGFRLGVSKEGAPLRWIARESTDRSRSEDGRIAPVAKLLARWVRAVRLKKTHAPGFAEGARVQTLIDLARRSHKFGREVACG